jgi:hypothetical protein
MTDKPETKMVRIAGSSALRGESPDDVTEAEQQAHVAALMHFDAGDFAAVQAVMKGIEPAALGYEMPGEPTHQQRNAAQRQLLVDSTREQARELRSAANQSDSKREAADLRKQAKALDDNVAELLKPYDPDRKPTLQLVPEPEGDTE